MMKARYTATISRLPRLALFEARGQADAIEAALRMAGLPWPATFNTMAAQDAVEVARIGPKRVLIMAPAEQEDGLGSGLEQAFSANSAADFVMLSDSFAAFAVDGDDADAILRQGAPLNLSRQAFPTGAIAGTELWATTALIARPQTRNVAFLVLVEASYAGYIESWLACANGMASPHKPGTMIRPPASLNP
jgi:heterotetrameric sarcosine oxidase gamma subunit